MCWLIHLAEYHKGIDVHVHTHELVEIVMKLWFPSSPHSVLSFHGTQTSSLFMTMPGSILAIIVKQQRSARDIFTTRVYISRGRIMCSRSINFLFMLLSHKVNRMSTRNSLHSSMNLVQLPQIASAQLGRWRLALKQQTHSHIHTSTTRSAAGKWRLVLRQQTLNHILVPTSWCLIITLHPIHSLNPTSPLHLQPHCSFWKS